jgi:hypothetical protein
MLRRLALPAFVALSLLLIVEIEAVLLLPIYGDICKKINQPGYPDGENCTRNNIISVIWWQVGETLNYYGAAIAAVATVGVFCFTGTLWFSIHRWQLYT